MRWPQRHPWTFLGAALLAGLLAVVPLLSLVGLALGQSGGGAAGSVEHWFCSPAALRAIGSGGLLHETLTALEVHWPHFLPALAGIWTLVYLWRAAGRHSAEAAAASAPPPAACATERRGVRNGASRKPATIEAAIRT